MRLRNMTAMMAGAALGILSGCASSELVTSELSSHVVRVPFATLRVDPTPYIGKWVVLGGKVLKARRFKDETQLEILQLPLEESDRPIEDMTRSQGRFLATQQEFLDPATVPAGTFVSLVGEVTGTKTMALDETEYRYVIVKIVTLKTWPERVREMYPYRGPWPYAYGPWPYPYWRDPFWGPPYWW